MSLLDSTSRHQVKPLADMIAPHQFVKCAMPPMRFVSDHERPQLQALSVEIARLRK
jgi:hypothetical protein